MKNIYFKIFIFILYVLSSTSAYSIEPPKIKNLIIYKEPKNIENIEFQNSKNEIVSIKDFENKLLIINFWATWCAPCRDEMPSLDKLARMKTFKNLEIIPINVGSESILKSKNFFKEINIKNLNNYHDIKLKLPQKLYLRGLPTTLLINKNGKEFARILGSIDFKDKNLVKWLKDFD